MEPLIFKSIVEAIRSEDYSVADLMIDKAIEDGDELAGIYTMNRLLVEPGHGRHQEVSMALQQIGSESTIPFVEQALEMGFEHLEYTASEDGTIAKWYSHLLKSIGTKEAINLIQRYSHSSNIEVAEEMTYRLNKI